jgi:hypothetical protein
MRKYTSDVRMFMTFSTEFPSDDYEKRLEHWRIVDNRPERKDELCRDRCSKR